MKNDKNYKNQNHTYILTLISSIPEHNLNYHEINLIYYHFRDSGKDLSDTAIYRCYEIISNLKKISPFTHDQLIQFMFLMIEQTDNIEEQIKVASSLYKMLYKNNLLNKLSTSDLKEIFRTIVNNQYHTHISTLISNIYYTYISTLISSIPKHNLNNHEINLIYYHFRIGDEDLSDTAIYRCYEIISNLNEIFPFSHDQLVQFMLLVIEQTNNIKEQIKVANTLYRILDQNNLLNKLSTSDLKEIFRTIVNNQLTSDVLHTILKGYDFSKFSKDDLIIYIEKNNIPNSNSNPQAIL